MLLTIPSFHMCIFISGFNLAVSVPVVTGSPPEKTTQTQRKSLI